MTKVRPKVKGYLENVILNALESLKSPIGSTEYEIIDFIKEKMKQKGQEPKPIVIAIIRNELRKAVKKNWLYKIDGLYNFPS